MTMCDGILQTEEQMANVMTGLHTFFIQLPAIGQIAIIDGNLFICKLLSLDSVN